MAAFFEVPWPSWSSSPINVFRLSPGFGPSVCRNTSGQYQDSNSLETSVLISPPRESSAGSRLATPWQQCCCNQRQTASALRLRGEWGGDCLQQRPTSALHLPPVRERVFNSFTTLRIQVCFCFLVCFFLTVLLVLKRTELCFSIRGQKKHP